MNQQGLQKIDAYRRASNYPAAGQLYLLDNPCCAASRRWGRELYDCPKYFGLWQGSLPPLLRGTAPPLA